MLITYHFLVLCEAEHLLQSPKNVFIIVFDPSQRRLCVRRRVGGKVWGEKGPSRCRNIRSIRLVSACLWCNILAIYLLLQIRFCMKLVSPQMYTAIQTYILYLHGQQSETTSTLRIIPTRTLNRLSKQRGCGPDIPKRSGQDQNRILSGSRRYKRRWRCEAME